jgi:hypothetical protein
MTPIQSIAPQDYMNLCSNSSM